MKQPTAPKPPAPVKPAPKAKALLQGRNLIAKPKGYGC